ncbi:MAG: hypothetical protein LUH82_07940 [Clostridiales bacterium]|nr:hypothetical protein [Clostridiales bacterium]
MEYDPQNPDDEVKIYTGSFKGRQINSISLSSTTTSGNIEASGNHVCELYIKYQVDKMAGDPATPSISSGLFQYKVGIN